MRALCPVTALLGTIIFRCVWGRFLILSFLLSHHQLRPGVLWTASFLFSPFPPSSVFIESPQRSNIPSSLLFFCVRGSLPVHYLSFFLLACLPSPDSN
jgi:hypothetical protein